MHNKSFIILEKIIQKYGENEHPLPSLHGDLIFNGESLISAIKYDDTLKTFNLTTRDLIWYMNHFGSLEAIDRIKPNSTINLTIENFSEAEFRVNSHATEVIAKHKLDELRLNEAQQLSQEANEIARSSKNLAIVAIAITFLGLIISICF